MRLMARLIARNAEAIINVVRDDNRGDEREEQFLKSIL